MIVNQFYAASVATTLALLFVVRFLIQIVQRRFFHPFNSVPGPWANSVSDLPAAWALVRGNQHIYYLWLHDTYDLVVRVSPDELSFISPEAREEIYGHRKAGLMEKSSIFLRAVGGENGETGLSLALHGDHSRQPFKRMATENQPVDLSSWYTYVGFDVIGELCFAEPFGCLDQASATEWSTSVINVFIAATWTQGIRRVCGVGTWFEALMTKLLVPAEAADWRKIHLNNSREKTIKRLAEGNRDHPDFMYQILNNESKKTLSQTEIILNMALFISAGTDTTATTLTGWTSYVCTHPDVYSRLVSEIRGAFMVDDDIKWENVKNLRYLEATIHEALRLFQPSPSSQQRIVPPGGATIDGYFIPAGKTVAVSPWATTHSRPNFLKPDMFRPERWLDDEKFSNDGLNASLPFGTGPRVCIARNLVYLELRLILAHLLWHFDVELDRGVYLEKNEVWGLDGKMKPMKAFHSMTKPELWARLKVVQR